MPSNNQLFTSVTAEHNTPTDLIHAAHAVLGGIDCDPATNVEAQSYIAAKHFYVDPVADTSASVNGLTAPWPGETVWLNPPFTVPKRDQAGNVVKNNKGVIIRSRVIEQWVHRWVVEMAKRTDAPAQYSNRAGGLLLVPARVDTQWFKPLWAFPMCFIEGRLHFSNADQGATFPTVVIYAGKHVLRFNTIFENFGTCGVFSDLLSYHQ